VEFLDAGPRGEFSLRGGGAPFFPSDPCFPIQIFFQDGPTTQGHRGGICAGGSIRTVPTLNRTRQQDQFGVVDE